jgi:hypothetical protein
MLKVAALRTNTQRHPPKEEQSEMTRVISRLGLTPLMFAFSILVGAAATGSAWAYQGHMYAALNALNRAEAQLQIAVPDKAGHREAAINLVNQAINQTNLSIAAGAR